MSGFLRRVGRDETGATAIEYGLIASLIVLAMVGALGAFADQSNAMWSRVSDEVEAVVGP